MHSEQGRLFRFGTLVYEECNRSPVVVSSDRNRSLLMATRTREGWEGWDDYATFYDWENAQTVQRRDVRFWERLAAAAGGPVLELGCGTGRISCPSRRAASTSSASIDPCRC